MDLALNHNEDAIVQAVRGAADRAGLDAYLIGGYIRDKLLDRPTKDMDILVVGDAILIARNVAQDLKIRPPQIFKRYGTAMIKYKDIEVEFVGARKESYSHDSRNPLVTEGSLHDDQVRRDFSINAMASKISGSDFGVFLDPFAGRKDLAKKVIRTPNDPDKTFSDDPLRMMRAVRFASQLNYTIDPETFGGIQRNVQRISIISQERITTELNKIIMSDVPSVGWKLLLYTGLCELIFPEFYALKGVDYLDGRGHKDNYFHTIEVLDNVARVSDNLWLRWAAVLHDIAKPRTKRFDKKAGWTFHGHDAVGANMVPKIFKRFRLPLDHQMRYVAKLVRLHLRPISLTKENISDSAIRRLLFDAGDDLEDLMILCQADITTKNATKMRKYLANYELVQQKMIEVEEKDKVRNWQPPITGEMIMETFGIAPSRTVGDIKLAIREAILDGKIPNNKDAAWEYMLEVGNEMGLTAQHDAT